MSNNSQRLIFMIGSVAVIVLGLLLILSSLAGPTAPAPAPAAPSAPQSAAPQPAVPQADSIPFPDIKRVSVGDAKAALDLNQAVFLDVRDPASFAAGHIRGARSIPLDELEARLSELDPTKWIITYCT